MWVPEVRNILRKCRPSYWEVQVFMDRFPKGKPRGRPDARITFMNLDNAILSESILDLKDG
jgi:hypothetical protein